MRARQVWSILQVMKAMRILLALWLSLSVPTVALAQLVSEGHCKHQVPAAGTSTAPAQHMMHAGMAMPADHAEHMVHATQQAKAEKGGCICGCNCTNHHCVTGFSVAVTTAILHGGFPDSLGDRLFYLRPAHRMAGHHLDLIRPPSLT